MSQRKLGHKRKNKRSIRFEDEPEESRSPLLSSQKASFVADELIRTEGFDEDEKENLVALLSNSSFTHHNDEGLTRNDTIEKPFTFSNTLSRPRSKVLSTHESKQRSRTKRSNHSKSIKRKKSSSNKIASKAHLKGPSGSSTR